MKPFSSKGVGNQSDRLPTGRSNNQRPPRGLNSGNSEKSPKDVTSKPPPKRIRIQEGKDEHSSKPASVISETLRRFFDRLSSTMLNSKQSSNQQLLSFFDVNNTEQLTIWMNCWSAVSCDYTGHDLILLPKTLLILPDIDKLTPSHDIVIKVLSKLLNKYKIQMTTTDTTTKMKFDMNNILEGMELILNIIRNRLRNQVQVSTGYTSTSTSKLNNIDVILDLITSIQVTFRMILSEMFSYTDDDRVVLLMNRYKKDIEDYFISIKRIHDISSQLLSEDTTMDTTTTFVDTNNHGNTDNLISVGKKQILKSCNGWHIQPTVGWLMSTNWISEVPELRNYYENSDEYADTMLHIWTLLTFYWGSGAVWPKCHHTQNTGKSNKDKNTSGDGNTDSMMCGSPLLLSAKYGLCSQRYNGQQCTGKATWKCFRHNHDMICDKCLIRHQNLLIGSPSHYSSTDIYDAIVDRETTRREGSVYIVSHLHSRKPPKIDPNWRTTYRLQPSCLIGVVKLGMSGEPLTRQHGIQWAEIVPVDMKTGRDLDWQKRQIGKLPFRLLSRADCQTISVDADTPLDINTPIAIIDLRVFVPEVVSVLATFSPMSFRQHLSQIPFVDCLIGRSHGFSVDSLTLTADKRTLIREAINKSEIEVVRRMPQTSKDTIFTRIMELKQVDTLYGTQLHAFAMGLAASVHCTQGPPGTGKSYVGVVLVLAYMIIRAESTRLNYPVGPILMLSYKNHALDEFLCDVLEFAIPKLSPRQLIRGGKPENPKLLSYAERGSQEEVQAEKVLKERVDMIRRSQKISREWRDCATHFATKSMSTNDMKLQIWKSTLTDVSMQGFTDDVITLTQAILLLVKYIKYTEKNTVIAYTYQSDMFKGPVSADKYYSVLEDILRHVTKPVSHWKHPVFSYKYSHEFWISKWIAGEMPPPRCQYCRKTPGSKNTSIHSDENKSADSSSTEDMLQCMNIADYHGQYCYSLHACRTQFGPCEKPRSSDHNVYCENHKCLYDGPYKCATERHPYAYYCSQHLCPVCMQSHLQSQQSRTISNNMIEIQMKQNDYACANHICAYTSNHRNTTAATTACNHAVILPWTYCQDHLCISCVCENETFNQQTEVLPRITDRHPYCNKHVCKYRNCINPKYMDSIYCISHICLLCIDKDTSGNTAQSIDSICPDSKLCPIHRCRFDNNCPNRVVDNSMYCIQHTCRVCIKLKSTSLQMVFSDDSLPPRNVCIDHILCLYTYTQGGLCHEIAISDSPFCHYHHQRQLIEDRNYISDAYEEVELYDDYMYDETDVPGDKDGSYYERSHVREEEQIEEYDDDDDMNSSIYNTNSESNSSYMEVTKDSIPLLVHNTTTSTINTAINKETMNTTTAVPKDATCSAANSRKGTCQNRNSLQYATDGHIYCETHFKLLNKSTLVSSSNDATKLLNAINNSTNNTMNNTMNNVKSNQVSTNLVNTTTTTTPSSYVNKIVPKDAKCQGLTKYGDKCSNKANLKYAIDNQVYCEGHIWQAKTIKQPTKDTSQSSSDSITLSKVPSRTVIVTHPAITTATVDLKPTTAMKKTLPRNAACSAKNTRGGTCKNQNGLQYATDGHIYCEVHFKKVNVDSIVPKAEPEKEGLKPVLPLVSSTIIGTLWNALTATNARKEVPASIPNNTIHSTTAATTSNNLSQIKENKSTHGNKVIPSTATCQGRTKKDTACTNKANLKFGFDGKIYCEGHLNQASKKTTSIPKKEDNTFNYHNEFIQDRSNIIPTIPKTHAFDVKSLNYYIRCYQNILHKATIMGSSIDNRSTNNTYDMERIKYIEMIQYSLMILQNIYDSILNHRNHLSNIYTTIQQSAVRIHEDKSALWFTLFSTCQYMDSMTHIRCNIVFLDVQKIPLTNSSRYEKSRVHSKSRLCPLHRISITNCKNVESSNVTSIQLNEDIDLDTMFTTAANALMDLPDHHQSNDLMTTHTRSTFKDITFNDMKINPNTSFSTQTLLPSVSYIHVQSDMSNDQITDNYMIPDDVLPDLPDMDIKESLGGRELDPDEMELEEPVEYEEVEENEEQRRLKEIDGDDIEHGDVAEVYSDDDDDDVDGTESRQQLPSSQQSRNTASKASTSNSKTNVSSCSGHHIKMNKGEKLEVEDEKVALELLKSWSWEMPVQARLSSAAYFLRCMSTIVNKLRMDSDEHVNSARKDRAQAGARAFRQALIVGSTVVGAARRLEAIRAAEPFAVVVEESCEVMEPTLMAVLAVKSLQKLELIGDHRQLPAFVQQCWYNLELTHPSIKTSLFERLVEGGSQRLVKRSRRHHDDDQDDSIPPLSCTVLDEQRRMRTCISDLTRCEYKDITDIQDHEHTAKQCIGDTWLRHQNKKAKGYEEFIHHRQLWDTKGREIPGLLPSVFFWNLKDNKESRPIAGLSACNETEAKAVAHLTRYLITCGVPAASITIITPYKGQKTQITKELRTLKVLPPYNPNINAMSDTVMVSTVDRYQGDENDIVILSLVRIRPGNRFVGLLNRFIVACSRARLGFYIVGTVDAVIKDTQGKEGPSHWRRLIDDLSNSTTHKTTKAKDTSNTVVDVSDDTPIDDQVMNISDKSKVLKDNIYPFTRVSSSLPICCPRHRNLTKGVIENPIKLPTDKTWTEFCHLPCTYVLPNCGHLCAQTCHSLKQVSHTQSCTVLIPNPCKLHETIQLKCRDVLKNYTSLQKAIECFSCMIPETYRYPDCNHYVTIPCHTKQLVEKGDAKLPECIEIVSDYIHPMCGHIIKTPKCHERRTYEITPPKCMVDVIMERICGCKVRMKCYEKIKELQQIQITPVQCYEDVNLPRPRCSHMISLRCHLATVLKKQYQNTYDICRTYGPEANTLLVRYKGTYTEEESMYFKKEIPTCYVPVNMEYPCGHIIKNIPCYEAFQYVKRGQLVRNCEAIVQTIHPICKHPISIPCYMKQKFEEIDIWTAVGEPDSDENGLLIPEDKLNEVILNILSEDIYDYLSHSCHKRTSIKRTCDPSHIEQLPCTIIMDIILKKKPLVPCSHRVQRMLPCNHTAEVLCSDRFNEPPPRCNIPVNLSYCYPCGQHKIQPGICHKYYTLLSQDNLCPFMIDYQLKRCKHAVQIKCHTKSSIQEYIGEDLQVLGDQVIVEANKLYGKSASGAPECTSLVAYMNDCGHLRQGVECHTAFDWAAGQLKAPNCERSIEHDSPLCGHSVNMKCCVWKKIDTWSAWTNDEHPYFEDVMDTMVSVGTRSDIITVRMYHEDVLDSPKVLPVGVSWKEIECKVPVKVQRNCHHILTMNCTDLFQCVNRLPPCIETVTHACEDCSVERIWQCQDYTKFIRNGGYNGTNQLKYACMNPVNKVCTVCGINRVTVSCSQKEPQCHQPVSYTLVSCGHEIQWHCGADNDPRIETYPCRTCVLTRWNEHIETQDTMMKELITQPDQLQVINEEFNMNCITMITDKIRGTYDIMKIHPIQNIKFINFFNTRMNMLKHFRAYLINKKVDILQLPPSYFNTIDDLQHYTIIYNIMHKSTTTTTNNNNNNNNNHNNNNHNNTQKLNQQYRSVLEGFNPTKYGHGYALKRLIEPTALSTHKTDDSILRIVCGIAFSIKKLINIPPLCANTKNPKELQKASHLRQFHRSTGYDCIEIENDDKHIYEGIYWEPSQVLPLCYIELKVHTQCCICQENYPYTHGYFCRNRHFLCWDTCFDGYVESARQPDAMTRCLDDQGNLRCPECIDAYDIPTVVQTPGVPPAIIKKLLNLTYVGKKEAINELKQALEDNTTRLKAEYDRIMAMKNEEERKAHLLRLEIVENILILRCPNLNCKTAFYDYDGCAALTCHRCHTSFCACCLQQSITMEIHTHVSQCYMNPHHTVHITQEQFKAIHCTRRQQAVQTKLEKEPKDVQRVVYKLLERDLTDLGIQIPRI